VARQLDGAQGKSTLNPDSLQRILAAAYVLQENNDRLSAKDSGSAQEPTSDYTQTLGAIVATQKLIQSRKLDLPESIALIAERLQQITTAAGVVVGIEQADEIVYLACTGSAASEVGSRTVLDLCLTAYCLRSGRILRCSNATQDSRLRAELCRNRGVGSLVAVPVFQDEKVVGVVELRFEAPNSFQDGDVRTSELMGGLVAEAIAKASDQDLKKTLAAERATILQTLEGIKPQLERLARSSAKPKKTAEKMSPKAAEKTTSAEPPSSGGNQKQTTRAFCRACAHPFEARELYCGNCGVARSDEASHGNIQSKVASLWYMQQAAGKNRGAEPAPPPEVEHEVVSPAAIVKPVSLEDIVAQFSIPEDSATEDETDSTATPSSDPEYQYQWEKSFNENEASNPLTEPEAGSPESTESDWVPPFEAESALELRSSPLRIVPTESNPTDISPWTSARKSREWLESLKAQQRPRMIWLAQQWQNRRGDIYTGIATLVLLVVLGLWIAQPPVSVNSDAVQGSSASDKNHRKSPPQPELSLFEELLVGLGLAEPPPAPVYLGNPDTQVWVDLHTALYYCPGSQLYGKTAGGKMTTQRDAQQDQFEPANRRVCD
jgi:ribosomal protein L37E